MLEHQTQLTKADSRTYADKVRDTLREFTEMVEAALASDRHVKVFMDRGVVPDGSTEGRFVRWAFDGSAVLTVVISGRGTSE